MNRDKKYAIFAYSALAISLMGASFLLGASYQENQLERVYTEDIDKLTELSRELINHADNEGQQKIFETLTDLNTVRTTITFKGEE